MSKTDIHDRLDQIDATFRAQLRYLNNPACRAADDRRRFPHRAAPYHGHPL